MRTLITRTTVNSLLVILSLSLSQATYAIDNKTFETNKNLLWSKYLTDVQHISQLRAEYDNRALKFENKTMRFSLEKRGQEPKDGYPLYIALHGGGSAPSSVNESQWEHMKIYYRDSVKDGIYVATRGITDNWNLHFEDESYPLYEKLIESAILFDHVDPNRVYFLGFSAGGDGVYQVVPRMADRFAAANMSAGHHNWINFDNLYNTPFLMQVGEYDSMYKRNHVAAENYIAMNKLQENYHGGYIHDVFIHYNGSHNSWYDNDASRNTHPIMANPIEWHTSDDRQIKQENTNGIDWVNQYTRQPLPEKIVWDLNVGADKRYYQTGAALLGQPDYEVATLAKPNTLFYWLDVSASQSYPSKGKVVVSAIKSSNTIKFDELKSIKQIRILLNPNLLNLAQPIHVVVGSDEVGTIAVTENENIMKRTLLERSDLNEIYDAEINLNFNDAINKWEIVA